MIGLLVIRIVVALSMILLGVAIARRSRRAATIACVPMLLLLVVRIPLVRLPAVEPTLFPFDWYPYVEHWWWEAPALFIMSAGIVVSWKSSWKLMWRRDGVLIATGLLLGRLVVSSTELPGDHENLKGVVDTDGICIQTSAYSCSAAASAAFLYQYGIETTEREMANLCVTRPGLLTAGTTDSGIMRGLRKKAGDYASVRITAPRYEEIPVPSMVSILITRLMAHTVVVEHVDADEILLNNPMFGRHVMTRDEFERRWQGSAITIEPFR